MKGSRSEARPRRRSCVGALARTRGRRCGLAPAGAGAGAGARRVAHLLPAWSDQLDVLVGLDDAGQDAGDDGRVLAEIEVAAVDQVQVGRGGELQAPGFDLRWPDVRVVAAD